MIGKHKLLHGFSMKIHRIPSGSDGFLRKIRNVRKKNHYVFPNKLSCKNHVPGRETAAVHCITLYENVENPGHSCRGLRNHISFAMQIVVRNGHLKSSGPKAGHRGVCVAMGPYGGPLGPHRGPDPSPDPRQPDSLVSGLLALPVYAKNRPCGK